LKLIINAKLQGIGSLVSIPSWFISAQQMAKLCYHPYLQFGTCLQEGQQVCGTRKGQAAVSLSFFFLAPPLPSLNPVTENLGWCNLIIQLLC
jgi:hypothetical protein